MAHDQKKQLSYSFYVFLWTLSKQAMRRMDSFGLKISQFLASQKVCAIYACSMQEFVENHLIKFNQPSDHLYFIMADRWTQKRVQNPIKHLTWSILQKLFNGI